MQILRARSKVIIFLVDEFEVRILLCLRRTSMRAVEVEEVNNLVGGIPALAFYETLNHGQFSWTVYLGYSESTGHLVFYTNRKMTKKTRQKVGSNL